jgi:hypothetical protein
MRIRTVGTVGMVRATVWKISLAGSMVELRFRTLEPVAGAPGQERLLNTEMVRLLKYTNLS